MEPVPSLGIERTRSIQLVVHYLVGRRVRYFPVSLEAGGWKIEAETNCIVIGTGQPRTMIPLSNVEHFNIEEVWSEK